MKKLDDVDAGAYRLLLVARVVARRADGDWANGSVTLQDVCSRTPPGRLLERSGRYSYHSA